MRYLIIFSSILIVACNQQSSNDNSHLRSPQYPSNYWLKVKNYQDSFTAMYASGANGVLLPEDVSLETKIDFYEPNEEYKISANFERIFDGEVFEMPTSTDRLPEYRPFGKLHFVLNGDSLELTLYQSLDHPDYLFCPFKDQTNGKETYGAGRYLDFEMADTLNPIIDFNYCYNPLCAYNHKYSCPIPPIENHLQAKIEAGIKKWH
jgi:uncharacterized protein (DUF1684 family)